MRPLSALDILRVWEAGRDRPPLDRAALLLEAASEAPRPEPAALSVGRRDARLLDLREATFGPRLDGYADCPRCAERLEFTVTTDEIREPGDPAVSQERALGDLTVRLRPPDGHDLAAIAGCADLGEARRLLLSRCVLDARRAGEPVAVEGLPDEVAGCLAEIDPQADVLIGLVCPACGHRWPATFDVVAFLWAELSARARGLLREVHALARAYGWTEAEILGLSAGRRRCYLELVGS